jgi:hypothetical protein
MVFCIGALISLPLLYSVNSVAPSLLPPVPSAPYPCPISPPPVRAPPPSVPPPPHHRTQPGNVNPLCWTKAVLSAHLSKPAITVKKLKCSTTKKLRHLKNRNEIIDEIWNMQRPFVKRNPLHNFF